MPFFRYAMFVIFAVILSTGAVNAHEYEKGALVIMHPHIPLPAKGSPVSAGYIEIHNKGEEDDVLLGVSSNISEKSQIHTMVVVDDIARMRPVKDGIVIPAGGKVKLERGGLHLMFMKLKEPLEEGQLKDVVLTFKNAGEVEIGMIVVDPSDEEEVDHSQHGSEDSHSDHSDHSNHSSD